MKDLNKYKSFNKIWIVNVNQQTQTALTKRDEGRRSNTVRKYHLHLNTESAVSKRRHYVRLRVQHIRQVQSSLQDVQWIWWLNNIRLVDANFNVLRVF